MLGELLGTRNSDAEEGVFRERALSPVGGGALLIGIVVVLSAVGAYTFLELTQKREPAPEVVLDAETGDTDHVYRLVHRQGETLQGQRLTLRGAANPETFTEEELAVGESVTFYPIDREVTLVWTGEYSTAYVLRTFEVDETLPDPDEDCDWVESETDGGTEAATIDGSVVNCDIETDDFIKVQNGGVVIGSATSGSEYVEADSSRIYGDITVEKTVDADDSRLSGDVAAGKTLNLQNGTITGSATSTGADVKLTNGSVGRSVTGDAGVDIQSGSSVGGNVVSDNDKTVDVDDATIDGDVMSEGSVDLDDTTVEGDVYASDFKCTDSAIDGEPCDEYSPKSPSDW